MVRVPLLVSESSAADNVTFCAVFQLDGVKVRLPPAATVTSVSPLPAVEVTVTLAVGWACSRTEKVLLPPSGTFTAVGLTTSACGNCPPPQVTPLNVKLAGMANWPLALKPTVNDPPLPIWWFQVSLLEIVTCVPDCAKATGQPFWMVALLGKLKTSDQPFTASPVLL